MMSVNINELVNYYVVKYEGLNDTICTKNVKVVIQGDDVIELPLLKSSIISRDAIKRRYDNVLTIGRRKKLNPVDDTIRVSHTDLNTK